MKALKMNYGDYFSYPDGVSDMDAFIRFVNENYHSFVKLKAWREDNCLAPYYIESEYEYKYLNIAQVSEVMETEITLLSKEEYDKRLKAVVESKCVHCEHYEEDRKADNLEGHRSNITLDGKCRFYSEP